LANFLKKVLNDKKLSVNDEVNLFIQSLVDRDNNYQHPKKPNILVTKGFGDIKIHGDAYKSYINFFDTDLSPSEKETLTATQDRLIQDETRRKQGEFFTPTPWVNEAHKMISETFGEDWKEKYVVWDCASGTGNLTRDYQFKELYCSTLVGSDIETMEQAGYNPEAIKFQYDFLNDGIINNQIDIANDPKLPQSLKDALLNGKEIIVFMNPPYGRSNGGNEIKFGTIEKNATKTKLVKLMKNDNFGESSSQLYTQFLYKIFKLNKIYKNVNIAIFAKSLFLSGESFKKFRNNFLKEFQYKDGMLFQASNFDDVSSQWGIDFTIWAQGETLNKESFLHKVKNITVSGIKTIFLKNIYNIDFNIPMNDFVKYSPNIIEFPKLSSGLIIKDTKYGCGIDQKSFSTLVSNANSIMKNSQSVYIVNGGMSENAGKIFINSDTFLKCVTIFTTRKTITGQFANWINDKDEYMAPTEEVQNSPQYKQFEADSIVYSLFNTSSNQSSMRQVEYKEKLWDIKNEFFFMSKDEMKALSEQYKFDELYKDVKMANDRYVYNLLKTTNLSSDAKEILELARELIRKSFEWRKIMHQTNPDYHLHAWDAGWYQIKKILAEHFKTELNNFNLKYKAFENRMRPQVYQLGFLKDDFRQYDEEYQNKIKKEKFDSLNLDDNLLF
jgi:hypothetical protein